MLDSLIKIAVVALIGYVVWRMMRPQHSVVIVMDKNGIQNHKGLPRGQAKRVIQFLEDHVSPDGKLTIYADRQPNGRLRLNFKGPIDSGMQQQVRNFFINVL